MTLGFLLFILLVVLMLVAAAAAVLGRRVLLHRGATGDKSSVLPYQSRTYLLSKGEAAFYHVLVPLLQDHCTVTMKVRLSDILKCSREAWRSGFGNRIIQKHVDFVVVDSRTTKILGVIELDDRSHERPSRKDRDEFVDAALASAGIPVIHFRAASQYNRNEVADRMKVNFGELGGTPQKSRHHL